MSEGLVIGLLGPTGVGKTTVAVRVAEALGTRIISCDSMQVYEGFPVLTNQPMREEEQPKRHDLVGFLDPRSVMTVGQYSKLAAPLVEQSVRRTGFALVAGGTGLYMRAALAPLAVADPVDPELRRGLEDRACTEGPEALHRELERLDAEAAACIDKRNPRRIIRALERVLASGQAWSGRSDLWEPEYPRPTIVFGLRADRDALAERILRRTEDMLRQGAVEEVERFRKEREAEATRPGTRGICSAIGYREISEHLAGALTRSEAVDRIAAATRRYARRQRTWLRKVRDAVMIEVDGLAPGEIAREIVGLAEHAGERGESASR